MRLPGVRWPKRWPHDALEEMPTSRSQWHASRVNLGKLLLEISAFLKIRWSSLGICLDTLSRSRFHKWNKKIWSEEVPRIFSLNSAFTKKLAWSQSSLEPSNLQLGLHVHGTSKALNPPLVLDPWKSMEHPTCCLSNKVWDPQKQPENKFLNFLRTHSQLNHSAQVRYSCSRFWQYRCQSHCKLDSACH